VAVGSVEPLRKLYGRWEGRVHFVDVLVRQAHPGSPAPPYSDFEGKVRDAQAYQREEGIPWTVLVDDLEGSVHRGYGGLPDPAYLIDAEGRVAYYNLWTSAPSLYRAGEQLLRQNGRGVVLGGRDRIPHMLPSIAGGWRATERGRPESVTDMLKTVPPAVPLMWLGSRLRPLLAPVALRDRPLPLPVKFALAAGAGWAIGRMLGPKR
jgi:hypothetical protein